MDSVASKATRQGAALPVTMGLLLILAVFGSVLRLLTHGAYREVESVNSHLRAIAVGEVGFSSIVARLCAAPWSQRWFAQAPEIKLDVSAADGTYSYLIRDTPEPAVYDDPLIQYSFGSRNQADFLVKATYGRSTVVMFWRLTVPEYSLENLAVVIPTYFTFESESITPTPASVDTLSAQINGTISSRAVNTPGFSGLVGPLRNATTVGEVADALGFDPGKRALDGIPSPDGSGVFTPNPPKLQGSRSSQIAALPLPPPPTPTVPYLEGLWVDSPVSTKVSENPVIWKNCCNHLQITQNGNSVQGTCSFMDDDGTVWTTWTFSTTFDGTKLEYKAENINSTLPVSQRPVPFWNTFKLDSSGQTLTGTCEVPKGTTIGSVSFSRQ